MKNQQIYRRARAFTLVEMLVVIVIIGLLIAALLPAFGAARQRAQYASAAAMFSAIEQGIQQFQAEQALGGGLPPSTGDNSTRREKHMIHDPGNTTPTPVPVAGAHLLVQALMGADGLGTPGFRDLDRDGVWWNNTSSKTITRRGELGGLYSMVPETGEPNEIRYAPYVDAKMKERMESFAHLANEGKIVNKTLDQLKTDYPVNHLMLMDPWDTPVLYYKANRAAQLMVSPTDKIGIYTQEDNAIITGSFDGSYEGSGQEGLDFGAGKVTSPGANMARYHAISVAKSPDAKEQTRRDLTDLTKTDWVDTFARFIVDPQITAKPVPVRPDSYLLISAGPDTRYGTADDVTNWSREKKE